MASDSTWANPSPAMLAAGKDEELAAYLAATAGDPPPDEHAGMWIDPDTGPPMGEDFWLGQLPHEQLEEVLAGRAAAMPPPVPVPVLDDITDHGSTSHGSADHNSAGHGSADCGGPWFG